jgi:hypothetical protein
MAVICDTAINTRTLTWDGKWFIGEASELPAPTRVWDDAADVGYRLVSHRTGDSVVFAMDRTVRDDEGDVMAWVFKPITGAFQMELHVLND